MQNKQKRNTLNLIQLKEFSILHQNEHQATRTEDSKWEKKQVWDSQINFNTLISMGLIHDYQPARSKHVC